MRTHGLPLVLSISAHAAVVLAVALVVGPRVTGVAEGRALAIEMPAVEALPPAPDPAPEEQDALLEPDHAEVFEPRPPDAERMTPRPLPSNEVLPPSPDAAVEPTVLADVPVRVAAQRTKRPPPAPRRIAPPRAVPAARPATSPAPLVPVHRPRHYPPEAYRAGLEGTTRVEITVDARGRVVATRLKTSSGHAVLDRAALASAREWRFRPPGRERRAVIPFRYDLP